jgi:hypothetical protein
MVTKFKTIPQKFPVVIKRKKDGCMVQNDEF